MKSSRASRPTILLASTALLALCACRASVATQDAAAPQKNLAPPQTQQRQQPSPPGKPDLCKGRHSPLPAPAGFVNDFAGVIDGETEARLESRLSELEDSSGVEFAVATVETTAGRDIFDYSLDVACGWGVGPPAGGRGGGLLLLAAVKDRKWRVQVGRSLEAELPDEVVKGFGDRMAESFKRGEYGPGIEGCVEDHIERLAGK